MSFMQQYVGCEDYFEVLANRGERWIVPADMVRASPTLEDFAQFIEGSIDDDQDPPERKTGWVARMTAPGYMDCTEWTAHATKEEARAYLTGTYGDDDDETEEE